MKKIKIFIVFTVALSGLLLTQCSDFGDINFDPNNPSQPDTRFLYVGAVRSAIPTFQINGTSTYDPWTLYYPQYVSEKLNVQFTNYNLTTFSIGSYYTGPLRSLDLIIKLNTDTDTKDLPGVLAFGNSNANQIAVARTLKAYIYMHITDVVGMIPYSEALKGSEGVFQPKYDTQQAIYTDLNKELEEAYAQFEEGSPLNETFEIMYNGDIAKWKKFNASVRMQLAIKLIKADPANGKDRFAKAYAAGFIRDNEDIFEYKFLKESDNQHPLYVNMVVSARRDYWPSKVIIDTLNNYSDPRLFAYAEEAQAGGYAGMPFGLTQVDAALTANSSLSPFHPKYYAQDAPAVLVTPSIILLAAAEAAERGWIAASAKDLYEEAITAGLKQHGFSDADANTYLAQPQVAYNTAGTQDQRIAQIAVQKWIASYLQDGFEAWADFRRLGVPALAPGPNSIVTDIPRRRLYDSGDYNANKPNYDIAIGVQGADAITTRVWWDQ